MLSFFRHFVMIFLVTKARKVENTKEFSCPIRLTRATGVSGGVPELGNSDGVSRTLIALPTAVGVTLSRHDLCVTTRTTSWQWSRDEPKTETTEIRLVDRAGGDVFAVMGRGGSLDRQVVLADGLC